MPMVADNLASRASKVAARACTRQDPLLEPLEPRLLLSSATQDVIDAITQAAHAYWAQRVVIEHPDGTFYGYSGKQTVVDPAEPGDRYYGSDSGWVPEPHIFMESEDSTGHAGAAFGFLSGYEATGDKFLMRVAKSLGDTLLSAQQDNGSGGWWYDMGVIGYDRQEGSPTYKETVDYGRWVNYYAWGGHGNVMDNYQDIASFDGVSWLPGYYLLRLYQALPGDDPDRDSYLAGAKWLADTITGFQDVTDPYEGFKPYGAGGIPQIFPYAVMRDRDGVDASAGYPYDMPHNVMPTLNDDAMIGALFFLAEFWQEALDNPGLDQQVYLDGVRLNVQYLIDVFDLNAQEGRGTWASQYWLSDGSDMAGRPTWGRAMEPPAFTFNTARADEFLVKWHSLETDEALKGEIDRVLTGHFLYWKYEAAPVNSRPEWIEALSDCPYLSGSMLNYDPEDVRTWYWWLWYNHDATAVDRFGDPVPLNAFVSSSSKITDGINDELYTTYYGDDALVWGHYNTSNYPMIRSIGNRIYTVLLEHGQGGASVDLLDGSGGSHDRTLSHYFDLDTENRLFKTGEYSESLLSLALTELDQDTGFFLAKEGSVGGQTRTYVEDWSFSSRMCRLAWGVGNTEGEATDSDGDGWSDVEEGAAGTDTHDSASCPDAEEHSPIAEDDTFQTAEDTTLVTGSVLLNDTDEDGDELSVASVTQPQHGTVLNNGDGTLTYTPAADWFGTDTFTYDVGDGTWRWDTALVQVTVAPVNDDPVARDNVLVTDEDTVLAFAAQQLADDDTDVDGDPLTVVGFAPPTHGLLTDNGSDTWTYTPGTDFFGSDAFTYTVTDTHAATATGVVHVTVTPVQDAPVAVDDHALTDEDTPLLVDVLANDFDVDADALSIRTFLQPSCGRVYQHEDGQLAYTPASDYWGSDTFTYEVTDPSGACDTATVYLTVITVNDDPVAADDFVVTERNTLLHLDLLANDLDVDGDVLRFVSFTSPEHGRLVQEGEAAVSFQSDHDYVGADTFTYTVGDASGGRDTATVYITVRGDNHPPVAADDLAVTPEDTETTIDILANDTDSDGDAAALLDLTQPAHGTVKENHDGTVTYRPCRDWTGTDYFTYVIVDGWGGSDEGAAAVTVEPVNDDPTATDDFAVIEEDGSAIISSVLANDTDVDGDRLEVTGFTQPVHGAVAYTEGGTFLYEPKHDYHGEDSFTYAVTDGHGGSASGVVWLTVVPVNDEPVAVADRAATCEGVPISIDVVANDYDVEGDPLTVTEFTQPVSGSVSANVDGSLTYVPIPLFSGEDTFAYTVSDGEGGSAVGAVTIDVGRALAFVEVDGLVVADAENATGHKPGEGPAAASMWTTTNDLVEASGGLATLALPNEGVNLGDTVVGPKMDYNVFFRTEGTYFVWVRLLGRTGYDDSVHVGINGAPLSYGRSGMTDTSDCWTWVDRVAWRTGEERVSFDVGAQEYATFSIWMREDGVAVDKIVLTTDPGFVPSGLGPEESPMSGGNHDPVAVDDLVSLGTTGSVAIDVLANDSDPDNDTLAIASFAQPGQGTVTDDGSGMLTYTAAPSFTGEDTFTYTVSDGHGGEDVAVVRIDSIPPAVSVDAIVTNDESPKLTGTIDDAAAAVLVTVGGVEYIGSNDGDSWSAIIGSLAEGTYDVQVTGTDLAGNIGTDQTLDELTIDRTAPTLSVDEQRTYDRTPELGGAVDDPGATIRVTVDGREYAANNHGDTWTLADNTIHPALTGGVHDIQVIATDVAGNSGSDGTIDELTILEPEIAGRYVFYNNSAFDTISDDEAVPSDKQALLPGQTATFTNYTSYVLGINGIMVDVTGPALVGLSDDDFDFRVGNSNQPEEWEPAPAPLGTAVRNGEGTAASNRIVLIWADGEIAGQWLRVTVRATERTGLPKANVFYFGNAIGDCGSSKNDAFVNATDEIQARQHPRNLLFNPAPVDDRYDYNRDRRVNATDQIIARQHKTFFANALSLIAVPIEPPTGPGVPGSTLGLEPLSIAGQSRPRGSYGRITRAPVTRPAWVAGSVLRTAKPRPSSTRGPRAGTRRARAPDLPTPIACVAAVHPLSDPAYAPQPMSVFAEVEPRKEGRPAGRLGVLDVLLAPPIGHSLPRAMHAADRPGIFGEAVSP